LQIHGEKDGDQQGYKRYGPVQLSQIECGKSKTETDDGRYRASYHRRQHLIDRGFAHRADDKPYRNIDQACDYDASLQSLDYFVWQRRTERHRRKAHGGGHGHVSRDVAEAGAIKQRDKFACNVSRQEQSNDG
jgi:hypothetical protein